MDPHNDIFTHLPERVINHLREIINQAKTGDSEEAMEHIVDAWLSKKAQFDKIIDHYNFTKVDTFPADNPDACLALTLSGSIVCMGPQQNDVREVEYHSIGFRTDAPDHISDICALSADARLDEPIFFQEGKIQKTSSLIDLAVIDSSLSAGQQRDEIKKACKELSLRFLEINKIMQTASYSVDDLRSRRDLFNRWIILEWFRIGGLSERVFMARAFMLWLELFSGLYRDLSQKIAEREKLDNTLLDIMNPRFAAFCDVYKWLESEKKDFDIGLMRALEEIPQQPAYNDFLTRNSPGG